MRNARLETALAVLLILSSSPAALAGGGTVSSPPAAPPGTNPATQAIPDTNVPKPTKPNAGTSDTVSESADTPAPTPTPPGTDASTAAPGGQAESTRNGALGTTGTNVPNRHHGPKKPQQRHSPMEGAPPVEKPSS